MPYPCPECCDPERCKCECSHCESTAPCCWTVVIAGLVATDPESCASCSTLNRAYYLRQDPNLACRWRCLNVIGADCSESDDITLTVQPVSAGRYEIRVELGDHIWIKDYGTTKPDCCSIVGDSLDHYASGSDCDSSSATCTITRHTGNGPCPCNVLCDKVLPPTPPCFKIEWEGISTRSPLASGDCEFCDCYPTTPQWIPYVSRCTWRRSHSAFYGQLCDRAISIVFTTVSDSLWRVEVAQGSGAVVYRKDYGSIPDVLNWSQEEIPKISGGPGLACDYTAGAKVLLTPDYTTECADRPWSCHWCLCQQDDDRPDVQVNIEGIQGGGCCDELNGTFILQPVEGQGCLWRYTFPESSSCPAGSETKLIIGRNPDIDGTLVRTVLTHGGSFHRVKFSYDPSVLFNCHDFDFTFNLRARGGMCDSPLAPFPRAFTL